MGYRGHSRRLPLFHILGNHEDIWYAYTGGAKGFGCVVSFSGSAYSPLRVGERPARRQLRRVKT